MNISNPAFYKDLQALERDLKRRGPNYWGGQVFPCYQIYDPSILDTASSVFAVDATDNAAHLRRHSGVIKIKLGGVSHDMHDEILFCICRTASPKMVRIRSFRYSTFDF